MTELYERLRDYAATEMYPFHMPGHKRQCAPFGDPFAVDITEIDGFDNLHHAEGILKEAQQRLAGLRGAQEAFFLVNGSTGGILSAVSACVKPGGRFLMARNCHKAAYHAAYLRDAVPVYLYPAAETVYGLNGGIAPETVEAELRAHPEAQAVLITSPTYDGMVSDVKKIADIAHAHGVPLIVDEAHGAHFGFHPYFPESAVRRGADIVIQSFHKTLPSLTQTAALFVNGSLVDRERLRRFLGIYQTSSPSYVFMASIDRCTGLLLREGGALFAPFAQRLERFRREAAALQNIRIPGRELAGEADIFAVDLSKLVLSVRGFLGGEELAERLRSRGLEMEMAAGSYALALTSFADTEEGFWRLLEALRGIDASPADRRAAHVPAGGLPKNEQACTIGRAWDALQRRVPIKESEGKVAAEFLYLYPPGIPLVTPGERIGRELLLRVRGYRESGLSLQGLSDYSGRTICVLDGKE